MHTHTHTHTHSLDNSDSMRNGDYSPSRIQAQNETAHYICNAKTQSNPESTVGFLSMSPVEVYVTPCRDMGRIMTKLNAVPFGRESNFVAGLKTAQLALKNRQNKNQRQRIVMFVGSPIANPVKELVKLGKNFKKNNVSVDVVNFGHENVSNENEAKLTAFMEAVTSSDNCHMITVAPGPHTILSDVVLSSVIMSSGDGGPVMSQAAAGGGGAGAGGASHAATGGVDPNMDPELAMVLRMSMEEERQRQESAAAAASAASVAEAGTSSAEAAAATATAAAAAMDVEADEDMDEAALLAQAIAMSMDDDEEEAAAAEPAVVAEGDAGAAAEPAAAAAAPADAGAAAAPAGGVDDDGVADALRDPDFIQSLLESVPGVTPGELALDDILSSLLNDEGGAESEEKKKEEDAAKK
jgi:26S proteasome regulatory subunit N10